MPIQLGRSRYEAPRHDFLSGYKGLSWVGRNRYDPVDYSENIRIDRIGTIRGGPTLQHAYDLAFEPDKYTSIAPTPRLGSPVSGGSSSARPRTGSFSLDQINWVNNLSQLTGQTIGQQNPYAGAMGWSERGPEPTIVDPMLDWFAARDMGLENAPRRLLDYAFSPIAGVASLAGVKQELAPTPEAKPLPFQTSPYYWSWLGTSSKEQRAQQARFIADSRADRARNQPLYDMLLQQFENDYNAIDARSSGNARIDYIAKAYLQNPTFDAGLAFDRERALAELEEKDPKTYTAEDWQRLGLAGRGELVRDVAGAQHIAGLVPWVGTQLASGLDPISAETEARWLALAPEHRLKLLHQSGFAAAATDMAVMFPAFGLAGKGVQFLGDAKKVESLVMTTRYADYAQKLGVASQFATNAATRSLDAVNKLMGVGLINMTASWAMQSYAPIDSPWAEAGRAMDASRVVSNSMLAGTLNEAGFWAGFYGVGPAFNALRRGGTAVAQVGPAGRRAFGGLADLAFHSTYGGSSLDTVLERSYGISRQFQGTAESALFESALLNAEKEMMSRARMALDAGQPTGTYLDQITDPAERVSAWEAAMALPTEHATRSVSTQIEMLNSRILGGEAEKIARAMDERVNRYVLDRYGQLWVAKVAGRLEVPQIRAAVATRLSALTDGAGDVAAIASWAGKDVNRWGSALRKTHQLLFHRRHTELATAADQAGENADRYALFTERNLFADDVDDQVARLADPASGETYMRELIEGKDDVERLYADRAFNTPDELAEILLQMRPGMPGRRFIEPGDGRLDAFQEAIELEGLWTIGTKPEGVFIRQQFGGWVNPAAIAPEAVGRSRTPVTEEWLVANGYRRPFARERMSGQEFLSRDPVWPTADQGGGVWIKERPGDAAPPVAGDAAALSREAREFADASAYWGEKPYAHDLDQVFEGGTAQAVYDEANSGFWMAEGKTAEEWVDQADDHAFDGFHSSRPIDSDPGPLSQMVESWEYAYIADEPSLADSMNVSRVRIIPYETLADGSVGIWAMHPKDLPNGQPFEGWDDLSFPGGGVEKAPAPYKPLAPSMPPGAHAMPPDRRPFVAAGTIDEQSAQLQRFNRARQDEVTAAADPDLLKFAEDMANGNRIWIEDAPSVGNRPRFSATKNSIVGAEGPGLGPDLTGFGATPDEALADLIEKMDARLAERHAKSGATSYESLRAAAARELREEMGFDARLDGWAGDVTRPDGTTFRYYYAKRMGGGPGFSTTPDEVGKWVLADPRAIRDRLTRYGTGNPLDQNMLDEMLVKTGHTKIDGTPTKVSGNNWGADWPVLVDRYNGSKWVFKAQRGQPLTSLTRSLQLTAPTANKLYQFLGLKVAPEVPFRWDNIDGTVQPFLDVDEVVLGRNLTQYGPGAMEEFQRIHVADWFVSQHDSNSGSLFLLNDGTFASVDKGQAWKFFGRDDEREAFEHGYSFWRYEPNPNTTLGNYLYSYADDLDRNAVEAVVTRIENLSDDQIRGWLGDLAAAREVDGLGSADDFIEAMIRRRDGLRAAVNNAYEEIGQLAIARPGSLQVWKPGGKGTLDVGGVVRINDAPKIPMQSPDFHQPAIPDEVVDGTHYFKVGLIIEDEGGAIWATASKSGTQLPIYGSVDVPAGPDDFDFVHDLAAAAGMKQVGVSVRLEEWVADILDDGGGSLTRWIRATRTGGGPKYASDDASVLYGTPDQIPFLSADGGQKALDRWMGARDPSLNAPGPDDPIASSRPMTDADPAGPAHEYVSYTVLPNGETWRSPWTDYPLRPAEDVLLGNRAFISQKLDSVFRGWRTSRILEMQKASLFRRLDSKSAAFTPTSVVRFHDGLLELARKHGFAGVQPLGLSAKWVELPGLKSIYDEVTALAEQSFGKGPYLGRNGLPIEVDWGREIAKAYRTSMKLNLTAGLTSSLKSMGYTGAQTGFISDLVYPALRFALSPLFKAGEWAEAYILNGMRGTNPFGMDDTARAIWQRGGLPTSGAEYAETALSDPMLAAMGQSTLRHDALRQSFMRTPPPDAYAAEVARVRSGPIQPPETAATQGAQPRGPLHEALFPQSPGERVVFPDVPTHDVDSLIPTKADPDTGDLSWDLDRIREINTLRLEEKIATWAGQIARRASQTVDDARLIGWAMGWLDSKFTRGEIRRLAENVPIIHATGSGYVNGTMDEMVGLADVRNWLEDGIKPLSGPAGRGQIDTVVAVTNDAGQQGIKTSTDRPSTSVEEQLSGHVDAAYAGSGRWNESLAFVLRNDRVIPRMVTTDKDRIGVMRSGTESAIQESIVYPNGVTDIYEAALRYGTIIGAADAIDGKSTRSWVSMIAHGGPFSSMNPLEHALPGGGTWEDIAAVMLGSDEGRKEWAELVAQFGDSVPGLRNIEVIGADTDDAWRFAMERAGVADRAEWIPSAGDIDEGRIPDLLPDDLITPETVIELEATILGQLRQEFGLESRVRFSLEDRILHRIARIRAGLQERMAKPSKKVVKETGWGPDDAGDLRRAYEIELDDARAAESLYGPQMRDLEDLRAEIAEWRTRQTMSEDEAVWINSLGNEDPELVAEAARIDGEFLAFMRRAEVMGVRVDSMADDWTFDGVSTFDFRKTGDPKGPAVGGISGELPPMASPNPRSDLLFTGPEQSVVVVRAANAYMQQARASRPRDVGTFGQTWMSADAAHDLATKIAPPEFIDELVRRAAVATGQPEPAPLVKVWQTGNMESVAENKPGRIIVTVANADGTYPLSLADIQEAWLAHGLPESMNLRGTPEQAPDLQSIWLDGVSSAVWTPDGAPGGKLLVSRPLAYAMPTGTWQIGVSGKWEFLPSPDLAQVNSYVGIHDIEFRYSLGDDEALAAWNLNDDIRISKAATVEVGSIDAVPNHSSNSEFYLYGLPRDGRFRFRMTADGKLAWAYSVTDRGQWQDVRLSGAVRSTSAAEEALRDARAALGGSPARVWVQNTSQTIAAGRVKLLGDLPDNWTVVDENAMLLDEDALRAALPRRPHPEPPPDSLEDVPGSAEALVEEVGNEWRRRLAAAPADARARMAQGWEAFWNPVPAKQRQQDRLIRDMTRDWFPETLERHMPQVFDLYHGKIGVPRDQLVDYILEDRRLMMRWIETRDERDFAALVAHADKYGIAKGPDPRAELDSLHESPDWTTLLEVMHWTAKGAVDEAFGVHFFNQYRSTFERSINHPLLGVYPASWAYKVAKEWARFLFANETFGFKIGMQPARFIYDTQHAQQAAFARDEGMELDEWYDNGPLSSSIFIFNLLMPGDWSNIPFPLSRTLRDLLRGQTNPLEHLQANLIQMGVGRDIRLTTEVAEEWWHLANPTLPERRQGEQELIPVR